MIVIPALDLPHPDSPGSPEGRLTRDILNEWEWLGFHRVQLVEPESRANRPLNRRDSEEILRDVHIDIQVSGDIRSADDIEALTSAGVSYVVIGPRALDEPDWLASTVSSFPDLLIVESPVRERRVRSRGWVRTLPLDLRDLADELSDLRLGGLLVTFPSAADIDHPDLALIEDLTERMPFPVLVGGGAPTLATLRDLEFRGVSGAIIDSVRLSESFDEQTLARSFAE